MKAITGNLKRASVEMLLLSLLTEQDMYGYQMVQEIRRRSNGEYSLLEGSMYPILYRLSDEGFISYEERRVGERLTRVYYTITPAGLKRLEEMEKLFDDYIKLIKSMMHKEA